MPDKQNVLIGKRVAAIYLAGDGGAIRFDVEGAEPIVARADGDCCSHTWIENVQAPENLIDSVVLAVEDIPMPDLGQPNEYEEIAYYGCKIISGKGECVIDYRNESNGYYGGSLEWPVPPGEYDPFYGGVYGQNVSKQEWKKIA